MSKLTLGTQVINLPCCCGDTVYVIPTKANGLKEITTYKVINFIIYDLEVTATLADKKNKIYQPNTNRFGETVFLTKEEAEEKLKELKK